MIRRFILSFLILIGLGIVFGVGFHSANEILGGTFVGDYIFTGSVDFTGSVAGEMFPKAYVRFNGDTGAIISSYNVGSVDKLDVGSYRINFENSLTDSNYLVVGSTSNSGSDLYNRILSTIDGTLTNDNFEVIVKVSQSGNYVDQDSVNVIVY